MTQMPTIAPIGTPSCLGLPNDWHSSKIGDVCEVKTGPFGSALHESDYVAQGTPIITVEHLHELGIRGQHAPRVSDQDYRRLSQYSLAEGDIVFSRVGSVDRNALVRETEAGWLFSGRLLRVRPSSARIHPPYLSYYFHSSGFKNRVRNAAVGQTMASLNTGILSRLRISFPPLPEQRAIAEALGDVDALIASQEKLIAKKRAIKTATMQRLLTGKQRLPGFGEGCGYKQTEIGVIPEDWSLEELGNVSGFITKGSTPTTYGFQWERQGILFLRSECVSESGLDLAPSMFISEAAHRSLNRSEIRREDILMTITGNVGRVAIFNAKVDQANINQHIARIRIEDSEIDGRFVYHYFSQETVRRELIKIVTGLAYPQLSLKQVREAVFPRPSFREQASIAEILTDIDDEVTVLEKRLAKTKAIKQGMMQELLTGRTRLV